MGFVYILKTEGGNYYIGSTDNLERRFKQHLEGQTPTTKRMGKLELIFSQEYNTLRQARYVENRLKKLKRKDYVEKIIRDGYIKIKPV